MSNPWTETGDRRQETGKGAIRGRHHSGHASCLLSPVSTPGFTLVEFLVVIAILGILVSLVTAGAQAARRKGAITKAKTMIASLETAIAQYEGDLGGYPPSGIENLVGALQDDPGDADWGGPYMDFKVSDLEGGELIDPWGHPYVYVSVNGGAPQHREHSYDLLSLGPNGKDDSGAGDDIYNW